MGEQLRRSCLSALISEWPATEDLPRSQGIDPEGGHGGLRVAVDEATLEGIREGGGGRREGREREEGGRAPP